MDKKERAKRIESTLEMLDFLKPYKYSVVVVNDTPVVIFDSISREALAKLNAKLKKWDLEHIVILDKSKNPLKA
jgi:hypothetical protein